MKFKGIQKQEEDLFIRYETTWSNSWQNVLDIMQVFLQDLKEVHLVKYITIAGSEGVYVDTIKSGLLHETEEFKTERGGIELAGISSTMEFPIKITLYNQLKIVDVQIILNNDKIKEEFDKDEHLLDRYMDSLEINGTRRESVRYGIKLYDKFQSIACCPERDIDETMKVGKLFKETCEDLGVTPFSWYEKDDDSKEDE